MRGAERPRQLKSLLFLCLAALAFATATSVSATPQPHGTAGSFRVDMFGWPGDTDPAVAQTTSAWQFEYATCAKLVNYPDTPPQESRLRPEIAEGMPAISADGRTYTFQIRDDFSFSPPSTESVTAASMKWTFERVADQNIQTSGYQFMTNIVGAAEYHSGQASDISGIQASGNTLTIELIQPQGDFLSFLAMPFFCAVPATVPKLRQLDPVPSAGPYYVSAVVNEHMTISRNPNYTGPRPQPFDTFEYYMNQTLDDIRQRVLSGVSDSG